MTARILSGTDLARQIREDLKPRIAAFAGAHDRPPGLGILLVGNDPPSEIYVRNKLRAASEAGIRAGLERLPETATLDEVMGIIVRLNDDEACDGILVQSPLPPAMGADAEQAVFDRILPAKDVDGFNPVNVGRLVQKRPGLVPGTPLGIIRLLEHARIPLEGTRAVVIGRSDIVGKPVALLLLHRNATVTVCHSKTRNLAGVAAEADLLVVAIGRPGFVRREFVKPGACVIDVGTNHVSSRELVHDLFPPGHRKRAAFDERGSVLVGDVHPEVAEVAGTLTPVPGGIGPLTIAMLLSNTVTAAENRAVSSGRTSP